VIIAKQRNGPIGTVRLVWRPETTRFENMERKNLRPHLFLMHTHGLFHNVRGSKAWKRAINETNANSETLRKLLKEM